MEGAFERVTGRRDACAAFSFAGMTDRAIARAGLRAVGARADEGDIDALLDAYVALLEDEVAGSPGFRVLEGVPAALAAAEARERCAIGLGTGNVRPGARVKLDRAGLFERFAFGGFGCDHEDRAELLRAGAARGAALLGATEAACRVVVIGDTPKDVDAARRIGAECLAVATGSYDAAALAACRPTHVAASLAVPGAIDALLG
jgi:phosphoglycolate phosphatase-like HAD superfamily hydrolase